MLIDKSESVLTCRIKCPGCPSFVRGFGRDYNISLQLEKVLFSISRSALFAESCDTAGIHNHATRAWLSQHDIDDREINDH